MTRPELTIVAVVLALGVAVSGGHRLSLLPRLQAARIVQARSDVQALLVVTTELVEQGAACRCPSAIDVAAIRAGVRATDNWGRAVAITCTDDHIVVRSSGPTRAVRPPTISSRWPSVHLPLRWTALVGLRAYAQERGTAQEATISSRSR